MNTKINQQMSEFQLALILKKIVKDLFGIKNIKNTSKNAIADINQRIGDKINIKMSDNKNLTNLIKDTKKIINNINNHNKPVVIKINGSTQVPVTQTISAGNDVELLLEFAPASYIVADDDLSVDNESVTVSVVEGSTNLVKLSVASGASVGESFEVKFRQQVIVNGSVTSAKYWPEMYVGATDDFSEPVYFDFDIPELDESATAVVKIKSDTYDYDAEFNYSGTNTFTCNSDDLPEDIGSYVDLNIDASQRVSDIATANSVSVDYSFKVLYLEVNGQQIYP